MKSSQPSKLGAAKTTSLSSPAWLLRGISSIPGELRLHDSRISFIANEVGSAWDWQLRKLERLLGSPDFLNSLKSGKPSELFNEPLTDIRVRSLWYYFSGGLVLHIRGESCRLSFGRPANFSNDDDEPAKVSAMRHVGKKWLRALTLGDPADA